MTLPLQLMRCILYFFLGCSIDWSDQSLDCRPSQHGLTLLMRTDFLLEWRQVLRILGVSDGDILCVQQANPHEPKEQAYQGLRMWIEQKWENGTWKSICQALEKLQKPLLAEKVYKLATGMHTYA